MRAFLFCSVIASVLCALSCGESSRPLVPGRVHAPDDVDEIILVEDPFNTPFPRDAVAIKAASVEGDLLTLKVAYAGGCKTHRFAIYGSAGFMESLPVQAGIFLSHDANGDACEAFIQKEIVFDLTPLKREFRKAYSKSGRIGLRITEPGTDEPIRPLPLYEF
jgi:hypothetical protein